MQNPIDKENMYDVIMEFPSQLKEGYESAQDAGKEYAKNNFERIIIAGMGGSALPGSLLELLSEELKLKIPVAIHRNYELPHYANKKCLVVAISYSGNTEETLSAYNQAKKKRVPIAVITSGGELLEKARQDNKPYVKIEGGIQPRLALGKQTTALLRILENAKLIPSQKKNIKKTIKHLKADGKMEEAKKVAGKWDNSVTPLIYSTEPYKNLAYILKIQVNENSKIHAFYNFFPELNHNEIMGYEKTRNKFNKFHVLLLRASNEHPQNERRMDITAKMINEKGYSVNFIDIEGKNMYNRAFNTILFGNWLSYYIAVQNNIDPTPVKTIEEFKKKLS